MSLGPGAAEAQGPQTPDPVPDSVSADPLVLDSLRARYRLSMPSAMAIVEQLARTAPGIGANSPTAFGADWGDVYLGASFAARARYVQQPDGVVAGGFGLGNAATVVGVDVSIISFSTVRSGFFSRTGIDVRVHRLFPRGWAAAVGLEGALEINVDAPTSAYAVASKWLSLADGAGTFSEMVVSVGIGNGRFRSEDDWVDDVRTFNVFGGVALRVVQPASLIVDWTGQDLAIATSVAPVGGLPLMFTAGFVDLTGHAGDGPRFTASANAYLSF